MHFYRLTVILYFKSYSYLSRRNAPLSKSTAFFQTYCFSSKPTAFLSGQFPFCQNPLPFFQDQLSFNTYSPSFKSQCFSFKAHLPLLQDPFISFKTICFSFNAKAFFLNTVAYFYMPTLFTCISRLTTYLLRPVPYSRSHNSVPVDRKKLNKTLKNNFFCFLSKNTYIYIYFTYIHIHFW
jgi:hypothetical protein